jgi:hypothetical protein
MNQYDDDNQLIAGAFANFADAEGPTMSAIGTAPLHTKAVRYRRTRATILSIAAVLVVALPVATYAALGQENQGPPPVPGESGTSGVETPEPVPSDSPSTNPSTPVEQTTQTPFAVAYFAVAESLKVQVYSYAGGKATLKTTIPDPYRTVDATLTISPDQTRLAWVEDNGSLVVSNVDGTRRQTLLSGVASAGRDAPMWTADSKRLVTDKGTVEVATNQLTSSAPLKGIYQVLSPGAQFTAYSADTGPSRVIVERADGTKVAEVPTICTNCESNRKSVLAVSPDGRYVALGGLPTAGEREVSWREILDTRTSRMVLNLDGQPEGPRPGRFLPDGTFVLHDRDKIKHMGVDGTVIATITMPDALRVHDSAPLRYPNLLLVN